jgi:hypothetical protein
MSYTGVCEMEKTTANLRRTKKGERALPPFLPADIHCYRFAANGLAALWTVSYSP